VPERLVRHTADRLLHLSAIDWNGEAIAKRDLGKKFNEEAEKKKESVRGAPPRAGARRRDLAQGGVDPHRPLRRGRAGEHVTAASLNQPQGVFTATRKR
jgi:hypothetical protein